jgi:hypothetical protein
LIGALICGVIRALIGALIGATNQIQGHIIATEGPSSRLLLSRQRLAKPLQR